MFLRRSLPSFSLLSLWLRRRPIPQEAGLRVLDSRFNADRHRHFVDGRDVKHRRQANRLRELGRSVRGDSVQSFAPPADPKAPNSSVQRSLAKVPLGRPKPRRRTASVKFSPVQRRKVHRSTWPSSRLSGEAGMDSMSEPYEARLTGIRDGVISTIRPCRWSQGAELTAGMPLRIPAQDSA